MQTLSLQLQSTIATRSAAGLDQTLAQAALRRVEAKEFVFAEGDPTTHVYRVETGAVALYKVLADGRARSWALPIPAT
jgi:CRP-like cAMP-binding protein